MTNYNKSLNELYGEIKNVVAKAVNEDDVYFFCDLCVNRNQRDIAEKLHLPLGKVVFAWNNNIDEIWHDAWAEKEMVSTWY